MALADIAGREEQQKQRTLASELASGSGEFRRAARVASCALPATPLTRIQLPHSLPRLNCHLSRTDLAPGRLHARSVHQELHQELVGVELERLAFGFHAATLPGLFHSARAPFDGRAGGGRPAPANRLLLSGSRWRRGSGGHLQRVLGEPQQADGRRGLIW